MKIKKKVTRAKKLAIPKQAQVRSKATRAHIAEGTRLFALAGRPTKAQFIKVCSSKGPTITWEQRAKAGVDAKHFQAALAEKGPSLWIQPKSLFHACKGTRTSCNLLPRAASQKNVTVQIIHVTS